MIIPLLWIAAFVFSLPLVEPHAVARLLAVTCTLGAAGVTVWRHGVPRLSPVVIAAGLFWALAAVSVCFSAAPAVSLMALGTFSLMPLSALAFIAAPERALRLAACGAGLVLAVLALWAISQCLFFTDMLVFGQVRHPFGNPNSYAALLALGVFPALGAAARAAGRGRVLCWLLAGLLVCGVVVIGGRAVTLLLLPTAALFFVLLRGSSLVRTAGLMIAAGVLTGFLIALTMEASPIMRLFHGDGDGGEGALFGRAPIWQGALAIFAAHPWTGTGIGIFAQYYPAYRLPADIASGGYMAHSDPLQFAVEMGAAAPLLFYGFLIAAVMRMKRAWKGATHGPWLAGLFCGLGLLAAHCHFDFDLYTAPVLCRAGLMLAVLYRETGAEVAAVHPVARAGALAALTAAFVLLQGLFIAEHQGALARAAAMKGDMETFGAQVNNAHNSGFGMNAQAYVLAATMPIGLMHGAPQANRPALYAQAMAMLARAEKRHGRLVAVPYYRAQAAALYRPADARAAEDWLRAALALNPQHTESRVLLAQRLRAAGQADEAYDVLKKGLNWPYGTPAARHYYDELGAQALMRKDMDTYSRMSAAAKRLEERLALPAWMTER